MNIAKKKEKKDRFIADIKDIMKTRTFLPDDAIEFFAFNLWYVVDYLRGYFTAER